MDLSPSLFNAFRDIAYGQAGIQLREGKEALVSARLAGRMRALGIGSHAEYLDKLRLDPDEMVQFVDAISTNFTSFYREPDHFDVLAAEAQRWLDHKMSKVRVWCAASSTGEEPYAIAITLAEAFAGKSVDYRILATDISTRVLEKAKAGRYTDQVVAPVPRHLLAKYFTRLSAPSDASYQVKADLKSHLVFSRMNLVTSPYPMKGPLDLIMCRNVMIYFDQKVRQLIVTEVERLLAPGALFIIGHSETLNGVRTSMRPVRPSVYRKAGP